MHPIHPLQIQSSTVYFFILIVSFKARIACVVSVSYCPTWPLPWEGLSCCLSGVSLPSHTLLSLSSSESSPGDDSLLWGVGERLLWEHWHWDFLCCSVGNKFLPPSKAAQKVPLKKSKAPLPEAPFRSPEPFPLDAGRRAESCWAFSASFIGPQFDHCSFQKFKLLVNNCTTGKAAKRALHKIV